jgi:hypothetical protein
MQYQKFVVVRFRAAYSDTVELCNHTFKIIKPTYSHSQEEQIIIDEDEYNFPQEMEFYSCLISEDENVSELLAEMNNDPNVEQAFESSGPAPPPF